MGVTLKIFSPDKLNKPCINCARVEKYCYKKTQVLHVHFVVHVSLSISEFVKLTNHSEAQKF